MNEEFNKELNRIPRDFDREKIWKGVVLPQKKNRRRGFFWWFGGSALLLGGVTAAYLSTNSVNTQNPTVHKQPMNQFDGDIAELITDGEDDMYSSTSAPKKDALTAESNVENKVSLLSSKDSEERDSRSEIVSKVKDSMLKPITESTEILDDREIVRSLEGNVETTQEWVIPTEIQEVDRDDRGERPDNSLDSPSARRSLLNLTTLPRIESILSRSMDLMNTDLNIDLEQKTNTPAFAITLHSYYGQSSHDFGESEFTTNRMNRELPLETVGVGLRMHYFRNNWNFFTGIMYTSDHTHFTFDRKEEFSFQNLTNRIKVLRQTDYSIYNTYASLDLNFGLGYSFWLNDSWTIRPSLHLNLGWIQSLDGTLFNEEDIPVELATIESYKEFERWQGSFQLLISRKIGRIHSLGLYLMYNSRKRLASFNQSGHSIQTRGVGLSITRFLR